ncbi:hypothetical protein ACFLUV_02295 [Elusimicrobiota bacterium]
MKIFIRMFGCILSLAILLPLTASAKKKVDLSMFQNTKIPNKIIIHSDIKVGDYAIFETGSAYGHTATSRYEILSEDDGVFGMYMTNKTDAPGADILNSIFYKYMIDAEGNVLSGSITETDNPENSIELSVAKEGELGYIPEFVEIDFESDENADKEIRKLGKKVDKDKVEVDTKMGKYIVTLKAYYLKGLSMGREYQSLVIYFTHPDVKFQGFFILQIIEAAGMVNAGVTELIEYGNSVENK